MTIHIFNPDHDLALAANIENFTSPHAGRQLRSDLGYIPALWADDGDVVIVDDVGAAVAGVRKLKLVRNPDVAFITLDKLKYYLPDDGEPDSDYSISAWGWNKSLRAQLKRAGVPTDRLPSDKSLDDIRELSSRHVAVEILQKLNSMDGIVGQSIICHSYDEVLTFLDTHGDIVVKAPWSSSGRGVRYLSPTTLTDNTQKWIRNTLKTQGTVVAEVRCNKVMDFAMEFMAEEDCGVKACGLSMFRTSNTAYTGNYLETEEEKYSMLSHYISTEWFDRVVGEIETYLSEKIAGRYVGALGVDMMICATSEKDRFVLNPCVEINLRRTMGHVALALSLQGQRGFMAIECEGKTYRMKVQSIIATNKNN